MVSGAPQSSTIVVDGVSLPLNKTPPPPGAVVVGPERGARGVLTMPTFEGYEPLPAQRFSEVAEVSSQSWLCLAVSLDYPPIREAWGETAGWLTPAVDFADFKEQFGVFAPRLGLLVPALFVIDTSDRVLYCEVVSALDAKVDFDAARDVLLG